MHKSQLLVGVSVWLFCLGCSFRSERPIWTSSEFEVYRDHIEQKQYVSKAISATELTSNYQSQENYFKKPVVQFKFSINSRDNEMISGRDHFYNCLSPGPLATPVIRFGEQFIDTTKVPANTFLAPNTMLTIRLDMRHVFEAFESKGFFETKTGDRIQKDDFKGVFVAGSIYPLTWDFDNLMLRQDLKLNDDDGDHIFEITFKLNGKDESKAIASHWKLSTDISAYPTYTSEFPLVDALYNLSLEEMCKDVEKDSTFRTGKEWSGVWTRDISYSIILSMAVLQPDVARKSLMRKVKNGMVVQDTGTGGAYPVSTDRMVWAIAAWEIYKVTGDKRWLDEAYLIIKKSLMQDQKNLLDHLTGLVKGESSFLDWREQTYPMWMQPADIFESECLGTNAVHYQARHILADMAKLVGDNVTFDEQTLIANKIKDGINTYLWQPSRGYYGQYLYGRKFKIVSSKSEALGEALCVLFGIADEEKARMVTENTPVNEFGIPCIYPQIPNIPPYHNNAVWPFVEAYWTMASAQVGNEVAVTQSLSSIYRAAGLFLTNKENFVSNTGDYSSTQINSDNMLWSISGNIAMIYKVIFGIHFTPDGLALKPFVPKMLAGKQSLSNFKYRNAVFDISMSGYGNQIKSIALDGKELKGNLIPSTSTGRHVVQIVLGNNDLEGKVNLVPHKISLESPIVNFDIDHKRLVWSPVNGAKLYRIFRNGVQQHSTTNTYIPMDQTAQAEFSVIAVDGDGYESFAGEPYDDVPKQNIVIYELEKYLPKANHLYQGYSDAGFVEMNTNNNTIITIPIDINVDGMYAIDIRYANGNGPVNTDNKCAMRTASIDNTGIGTFVFPQRGKEEWSDWGYSNILNIELKRGKHNLILKLLDENENMNGTVNQAMIDFVRFSRLN